MTTLTKYEVGASFINDIEMNIQKVFSHQERKVLELMLFDGHVSRLTGMHSGIVNITARIAELRQKISSDCYRIDVAIKTDANGYEYGGWHLVDTTFANLDHYLTYDASVPRLSRAAA